MSKKQKTKDAVKMPRSNIKGQLTGTTPTGLLGGKFDDAPKQDRHKTEKTLGQTMQNFPLGESDILPADYPQAPEVIIPPDVYAKMMFWVDKAPGEVSGLGKIELSGNQFLVTHVMLLAQENTGASTDIDGKAVAKAMFETKDMPGTLNFWWHSHANMNVFWSGTDLATIRQLGGQGWFISTVVNKRREKRSAYFQGENNGMPELFVDNIDTDVRPILDEGAEEAWEAEYRAKCKAKTYPPLPSYLAKGAFTGNWRDREDTPLNSDVPRSNPGRPKRKYWDALTKSEQEKWLNTFVMMNGINPIDETELEDFYDEWCASGAGGDIYDEL